MTTTTIHHYFQITSDFRSFSHSQSCPDALSQRRDVPGVGEPRIGDELGCVTAEVVLVVVGTVAVVVHESDVWRNVDDESRSRDMHGRRGVWERVERSTDVVDAELEDDARSHHHFRADSTERAATRRRQVITAVSWNNKNY